jgi:lipopolysaccharide transport system ATP-binding protein
MSDVAIRVENLSKMYRIGAREAQSRGLGQTVRSLATSPFAYLQRMRRPPTDEETLWALKDVSFEVKQGEVIGVIGRNGAGKSTLLKILSRITEPSGGEAQVFGRVGSLLEVGTGFHPELTGRENIYLNGAILGMRRYEIDRKFDEIVDFSGVEKFLDTPVKRYSSGMYVRLAFAVAAHLEPEILLVDEVLAVGDAEFQKKCLGKMGDVAKGGRTVLFVSHNMVAVLSLCKCIVWLDQGQVRRSGVNQDVVPAYMTSFQIQMTERTWDNPDTAPGNEQVRLHSARVVPDDDTPLSELTIRTPFRLVFEYWNLTSSAEHSLTVNFSDGYGSLVFASDSKVTSFGKSLVRGICRIPANLLNDGIYRVELVISRDKSSWIYNHPDLIILELHDIGRVGGWLGKWPGVIRPTLDWSLEPVDEILCRDQ